MEAFRTGELGQAVLDFEELVERHPAHPLAGSARFWIGEAYFRTREFQQAAVEYQKAIDGSPGSDKVPEALLKLGLAQRALDLTLENVKQKKSLGLTRSMAYHPEVQHSIADMVIEMESIGPHLDRVAQEWSDHVDHGPNWAIKLIAAKYRAVEGSWRVVDTALELSGGMAIFKRAGMERLWRDARLGRIHPANTALAHEFIAKTALQLPEEGARWG